MPIKKSNIQKAGVTILGKWPFEFSQVVPYIHEFERRGVILHFCVSREIKAKFSNVLKNGFSVTDIDILAKSHRLAMLTHKVIFKLNSFYKQISYNVSPSPNPRYVYLNKILKYCTCLFINNPFPTKKILLVTPTITPWLLTARGVDVYTIVGSWDHPVKINAAGYTSKVVFSWNYDLAGDWEKYQGDSNSELCYPLPFKYVIDHSPQSISFDNNRGWLMYPFTWQSTATNRETLFNEECVFVKLLCEVACELKYNLFLKPKPNDKFGSLDSFKVYDNVRIGTYNQFCKKGDFQLNQDYNNIRLKELDSTRLVFNISTTFGLDSSLYGLPVLQLYFRSMKQFPAITARHNDSIHINRYILKNTKFLFTIDDQSAVKEQLRNYFQDQDSLLMKSREFSTLLRKWILPNETMDQAVSRVVDRILK
jgi:hypothetical protein